MPTRQSRSGTVLTAVARAAASRRASSQLCSRTAAATASITSRLRLRRTPLSMSERSAMVVVKRSSQNSIGAAVRSLELGRKPSRMLSSVAFAPIKTAGQPDHHLVHVAIFHLASDACPHRSRVVWNRRKRCASVHVSSETASPTRTVPTSMPRTRLPPVPSPVALTATWLPALRNSRRYRSVTRAAGDRTA